ncbi:protein phosphatase 2C domain-containing protein [Actinophytocola sp. KF-1]
MQVTYVSVPGSATTENQDFVVATDRLVCVLDGVTPPASGETGCRHGVRWYVEALGHAIAGGAVATDALPDIVARAIADVARGHEDTCDLRHPDTPSAALAALRVGAAHAEYLVLCDCAVVLDQGGEITVHTDAIAKAERSHRTTPAGPLWKAAAVPGAAFAAVTGRVPLAGPRGVRCAALATDGVTRAVLSLGMCSWQGLMARLSSAGPHALVRAIRAAESARPHTGGARPKKKHDDATAVVCELVR